MKEEQTRPHVPMTEEERGNTWEYCYGQPVVVVLPPPTHEETHEHHQ